MRRPLFRVAPPPRMDTLAKARAAAAVGVVVAVVAMPEILKVTTEVVGVVDVADAADVVAAAMARVLVHPTGLMPLQPPPPNSTLEAKA